MLSALESYMLDVLNSQYLDSKLTELKQLFMRFAQYQNFMAFGTTIKVSVREYYHQIKHWSNTSQTH